MGLLPKRRCRSGDGAGLLGIVNEVALGEVIGLFTDDFDGVLIGAYGAIGAESIEKGAYGAGSLGGVFGVKIEVWVTSFL